jgi:hypothetical protein
VSTIIIGAVVVAVAGLYLRWAVRPILGAYSVGRQVGRIARK